MAGAAGSALRESVTVWLSPSATTKIFPGRESISERLDGVPSRIARA